MRLIKFIYKFETRIPMLALTFASAISVMIVLIRIILTHQIRYGFLAWNLFLAWLPLIFALLVCELYQKGERRSWRLFGLAGAWLLFFPNAPYIFTDLIHVTTYYFRHFWVDLTLVLMCALTGLVLGFVSLYLMQSVVARMFGRTASWFFIAIVTGLSGFGIYLGRFWRLNSWDVVTSPFKLYHGVNTIAGNSLTNPGTIAFPLLFATFLFVTYVMLYALTHLPRSGEFAISVEDAKPLPA